MKNLIILCAFFIICACQTENKQDKKENTSQQVTPKANRPVSVKSGKIFDKDGKKLLYGGEDDRQHFDITNTELKDEQFHYGIGRERFPALLAPEFINIQEADPVWPDSSRFLVAYAGEEVKAYSIKDLTRHEVVNDELNGQPIMAAYCVLADLGAVYDRTYGDKTLTFALSGYTYYDENVWNGLDGFVLWDRETESLWWPLIDKAVSGPLKNVGLLEMESHYEDITWGEVKNKFPNAQVLKSGQDFERPKTWEKLNDVSDIVKNYTLDQE